MAPPTMAPVMRPAATPAATPRCAWAGVVLSEAATVATATMAANVFFMSCSWRAHRGAGLVLRCLRKAVPSREAQNGQPKVNAGAQWPEKAVFSGHLQRSPRETLAFPGASRAI